MEAMYMLIGIGIVVIPALLWAIGYSFLKVRRITKELQEQDRYYRHSIENLSNHISNRFDKLSNEMYGDIRNARDEFSRKYDELVKDRTESLKDIYNEVSNNFRDMHDEFSKRHDNLVKDRTESLKDIYNELSHLSERLRIDVSSEINDIHDRLDKLEEPETYSPKEHQLYS